MVGIFWTGLKKRKTISLIAASAYGIFLIWSGITLLDVWSQRCRVIFFDVGQGDSALIQTKEGKKILIDGGPDRTVVTKLGKWLWPWERTLDAIILSHPHADHVTGLNEVMRRYNVASVYAPEVEFDTPEYTEFMAWADAHPGQFYPVTNTIDITLGDAVLHFIYPQSSFMGAPPANMNDTSIVVKIDFHDWSFLFAGDAERTVQEKIASFDVASQVYKVPHHGAANGWLQPFLEAVQPQYSVISVGRNTYGHPSQRFIRALKQVGSRVYITRRDGDVVMECANQAGFTVPTSSEEAT